MDTIAAEESAERARKASAEWAKMPLARRYPGLPEGLAGLGMAASFGIPYFRTRGGVRTYNAATQDIRTRWRDAIDRAKNNRLAPGTRTAAANEARELQAQYEAHMAARPGGGHVRAFAEGAVPTEAALATPLVYDYLAGGSDPSGELRERTMHSINPMENPGEVLGRYGLGLGFGGVLGEAGHMMGERGMQRPAGYQGETRALLKRYTKRSR